MENKSGITPVGDRVIVKPDVIKEETQGKIYIPEDVREKHAMAQTIGTFIAAGPDAWLHRVETTYTHGDLVEVKEIGYSQAFAEPGDRVAFAKYGGLEVKGADGEKYRILNDEDITAIVTSEVSFTDLETRTPVGQQ